MLVQQRQVQVELAREVLVEHRLADPGALGDVVHRGSVVPLRDEDLLSRAQELVPSGSARQSRAPRTRCFGLLDGCHAASHFL
ncbi:hypothetical protein Sxan_49140 [Streptomyces xanthophaeus]|uniref:Uncharacterized protein n=1 Tax=Streptomyces xanthophaeus TaxID=67385 RepID=A0A919GZL1_9ACTN|nr:hypothetical protein Sxan_49140 [Streptomyces xanthophaeus]